MDTQGKPFATVFTGSSKYDPNTWRIRNSGVKSWPGTGRETRAVLEACKLLAIPVKEGGGGSAANASSYAVSATILDGGIEGQTGDYWYGPRGVWVRGPKAVLLLALQLGLSVQESWYRRHGLAGATLASLKRELLIAELEAIDPVQDRIDRLAKDLSSKERRYAVIDGWALGELLEIDFDDAISHGGISWGYRARIEDAGYIPPFCRESLSPEWKRV
jgi:hypothetical protein